MKIDIANTAEGAYGTAKTLRLRFFLTLEGGIGVFIHQPA